MLKQKHKIYIGTSGFEYNWNNFYKNVPKNKKLEHYSKVFNTVEINYSFYRLPEIKTFKKWFKETPDDFCFSLKLSRYITHVKRLKNTKQALDIFLKRAYSLKTKLGPILIQLPANFKLDLKVLEYFLKDLDQDLRIVFEFRQEIDERVVSLLKKHNKGLVFSHSSKFPYFEKITSDFIYLRMHGSEEYGEKKLKPLALKIKNWNNKFDVYVYFNNDQNEYAISDAKKLIDLAT